MSDQYPYIGFILLHNAKSNVTQLVFLRPPQYAFPPAIGRRGRDHIFDVVERAPRDRAMMIIIKKSCCCGRAAAVCCAPEFGITPGIIVRAKIYSPIRLQIQRNESDFRDSPHSLPPFHPPPPLSFLLQWPQTPRMRMGWGWGT